MLTHPTYDRLLALGLTGMAKALEEQRRQRNVEGLSFEERLGLLVDREAVERESKRLVLRLKYANLRQSAVVEDLDTMSSRSRPCCEVSGASPQSSSRRGVTPRSQRSDAHGRSP